MSEIEAFFPYPMRFEPILQPKVWGGHKLKQLHKKIGEQKTGESWEISAIKGFESIVANGIYAGKSLPKMWQTFGPEIAGNQFDGSDFPLLIKFLDAAENLSVQVHPDDNVAQILESEGHGKTEMWYVLHADQDARIFLGLKKTHEAADLLQLIETGAIVDHLRMYTPKAGDIFYVPAGTIHAIGGGVLLAEIQQSSDTTYRLYDWNRENGEDKARELHLEKGMQAVVQKFDKDLKCKFDQAVNTLNLMVQNRFFKTHFLLVDEHFTLGMRNHFVVLMCVHGEGVLRSENFEESFRKGDSFLVPAALKSLTIEGSKAKFLYITQ